MRGAASLTDLQPAAARCGRRGGGQCGGKARAAHDEWLGWDDAKRGTQLNGIVCNSRFLILPTVRVKHLGSHVLGQLTRPIAADWQQRYSHAPWLMETYVEATRSGTVYRAANWIEVGMTAGRGRQDSAGKGGLRPNGCFSIRYRALPSSACAGESRRRWRAGCTANSAAPSSVIAGWRSGSCSLAAPSSASRRPISRRLAAHPPPPRRPIGFFDHDRVTMDALLEPHHQATIDRMRR